MKYPLCQLSAYETVPSLHMQSPNNGCRGSRQKSCLLRLVSVGECPWSFQEEGEWRMLFLVTCCFADGSRGVWALQEVVMN